MCGMDWEYSVMQDVQQITETTTGNGKTNWLNGGNITRTFILMIGFIALFLNVNRLFGLQMFVGYVLLDTSYYYLLLGLFLCLVFQFYPTGKNTQTVLTRTWDWVLTSCSLGSCLYLAWNGNRIIMEGWDLLAPEHAQLIAALVCTLVLEALRRAGGLVLLVICSVFFAFPLYSDQLVGFLWGPSTDLPGLVMMHVLGTESIIGVPMRVVAGLLIGFLVFGSALVVTGGGDFFMAFAAALLGRTRGGPSKVSILSSGFFGSLSGSVISNVVTTGQMTIPTMKRVGYPARYAAAIEACASTGGALMPPVMGAVAFIMAENLDVPYVTVMTAAIIPALLFYLALLLQTDCFAARNGLKGQPAEELPKLSATLKSGWHFLFSLFLLVYLIVVVGNEAQAPYYATLVLLFTSFINGYITKKNQITFTTLLELIEDSVKNISNMVGVLAGIGLIVGALSYTGVGGAFSRELVRFAGDNIFLILLLGALTSFVLGMGMTVSACYIFLAIVIGPAMVDVGIDPIAGHLFILYWGMLSYITPPVALAAFAAAIVAKTDGMRTGILAMRLGAINFILPFLFALNPTLVMRGDTMDIIHNVGTAIIAVWLIACGGEGWLHGVGRLKPYARLLLLGAACLFIIPGYISDSAGVIVLLFTVWLCKVVWPESKTEAQPVLSSDLP